MYCHTSQAPATINTPGVHSQYLSVYPFHLCRFSIVTKNDIIEGGWKKKTHVLFISASTINTYSWLELYTMKKPACTADEMLPLLIVMMMAMLFI